MAEAAEARGRRAVARNSPDKAGATMNRATQAGAAAHKTTTRKAAAAKADKVKVKAIADPLVIGNLQATPAAISRVLPFATETGR